MSEQKTPNLTAVDWIAAAFRRLGTGGIAAVRAEVIARDLGVSKGSFYWHFKNIPDLHARMLAHWWDEGTQRIVRLTEEAGRDPQARIARLLELATSDLADPYGGLSTEAAIRDWARTDPLAAKVQAQADTQRRDYVEGLAREAGLGPMRAAQVARVVMMAYTGAIHLGVTDRAALRDDLNALVDALLLE